MDTHGCEPPFWKDLSILFKEFSLQYKPTCEHSVWNFIARIMILSVFVGMIGSVVGGLPFLLVAILFGAITASAIIMMTPHPVRDERVVQQSIERSEHRKHGHEKRHMKKNTNVNEYHTLPFSTLVDPSRSKVAYDTKEHFVNGETVPGGVQSYTDVAEPFGIAGVDAHAYAGPSLPDYTPPTSKNLFMNVLLDEMKYNPDRPEAAPIGNPTVKQTLDDYFRVHWYSDPTDVFGKNQNQRQYVTQPSTTVPNDQGSFANWLYKIPGKTCKEGGRAACLSGTDDGKIPWLNHAN
jgi:hypothetical protein